MAHLYTSHRVIESFLTSDVCLQLLVDFIAPWKTWLEARLREVVACESFDFKHLSGGILLHGYAFA
jgi:hypothetical protein